MTEGAGMARYTALAAPANGPLAEFAAELRALRATLGRNAPTVDQISANEQIPRSTLYAALRGTRLPSRETVGAFARAWGGDEAEWLAKRIALEDQMAERRARWSSHSLRNGNTWLTLQPPRTVLMVVRSAASAARLLDVAYLLGSDMRIQIVATVDEGAAHALEASAALTDLGVTEIAWSRARERSFDLVLATQCTLNIAELSGPLAVVLPFADDSLIRMAEANPGAPQPSGARHQMPSNSGHPWPERYPRPDLLGVANDADLQRLKEGLPDPGGRAVIVGDPTLDRMLASRPERSQYRRSLGVRADQRLIVVCSTWGPESLFAQYPWLVKQLLAELAGEEYRVALILHSSVWSAHGSWQIAAWLQDAIADGLLLIPPLRGEQATLVAADLVIGDHGLMTFYAAALGNPVLALDNHVEDLAPRIDTAGVLDLMGDLSGQLESVIARAERAGRDSTPRHDGAAASYASGLLREKLYEVLELELPAQASPARPVKKPCYVNDFS